MTLTRVLAAPTQAAAAIACWISSAGFSAVALWTHLRLAALGPICGLSRPVDFFFHCPACPAALTTALLAAGLSCCALVSARRAA